MNSISEIREEYARLCAQLGSLVANRERLDDGIKDLKSRILQLDVNYQALVRPHNEPVDAPQPIETIVDK